MVYENEDVRETLDVLGLLLDGSRTHSLPSMLLLVVKDVSNLYEFVWTGSSHSRFVAPVDLLLVLVLDLGVDDFPVEIQPKVGPILHRDAYAVREEKFRGPRLGDEFKYFAFVRSE